MAITLTRRLGESVIIQTPQGELVEVEVAEIRRGQVRLRTHTRDPDTRVWRNEVFESDDFDPDYKHAGDDQ